MLLALEGQAVLVVVVAAVAFAVAAASAAVVPWLAPSYAQCTLRVRCPSAELRHGYVLGSGRLALVLAAGRLVMLAMGGFRASWAEALREHAVLVPLYRFLNCSK